MLKLIAKIFGSANERFLTSIRPDIAHIGSLEEKVRAMSDDELRAQTAKFKEKLDQGATLDDILHESFATVREAGRRVLNMRHYDVQLIGGMVIHKGKIAEMRTGEGKTLVATSPLYLNALSGKGAHLVTVNDYLAARDAEWMGRIYNFLGLSVGIVTDALGHDDDARRRAYGCDITYGTNNEFGFDYLRDNMKYDLAEFVQRELNFAIVDEVDSILIDEARTPLIISGQADELKLELYNVVNDIIPYLRRDEDYLVDEENRSVTLTERGINTVEKRLGIDNLYDPINIELVHHVSNALRAHHLYKLDEHYMIVDGEIVIIDEFTGRAMEGRRWSDGLHQAVEAKEHVEIQDENQTMATVTYQNFFRMYGKLGGMTGTAETEAQEFHDIYKLDTIVIPTNRPIQRIDAEDVIYRSYREKFNAIVEQIIECNERQQPVLVGTTSVEKSEAISQYLRKKGISHEVLNAKQHGREASIVMQAGRLGAVTIATNMAGRGTDIKLGGSPEDLLEMEMGKPELPPGVSELDAEEHWTPEYRALRDRLVTQCEAEREKVLEAGGLFIIGTERHESRRIDNQLRGRAGRQGDPGASRFFLSLEDDLLRLFNADRVAKIMDMIKMEEGVPIEHPMVTKSIENAQKKVEGRNFDIRKNVLEYDDVMDLQRKTVYGLRKTILSGEDEQGRSIHAMALDLFEDVALAVINTFASEAIRPEDWELGELAVELKNVFGLDFDFSEVYGRDGIEMYVWDSIKQRYDEQRNGVLELANNHNDQQRETYADMHDGDDSGFEPVDGQKLFEDQIRTQYLRSIDRHWRGHLQGMEQMRDGIGMVGYAQKDPKKEYKKRGFELFTEMMSKVKTDVVEFVCRFEPSSVSSMLPAPAASLRGMSLSKLGLGGSKAQSKGSAPEPEPTPIELPRLGRNDPCHCGSGLKYKSCHMAEDRAAGRVPGATKPTDLKKNPRRKRSSKDKNNAEA